MPALAKKAPPVLTPRQRQIVRLVSLGCTVGEIAAILKLSPSTVDNHRARAMAILGTDKAALVTRLAIKLKVSSIELLAGLATPAAGESILHSWRTLTPDLRGAAINAVLGNPAYSAQLLDQLGNGEIPATDLDALQRQRFLDHSDEAIRAKAAQVFAADANGDRQQIVTEYIEALGSKPGDVAAGRLVFGKHCSSCHALEGQGYVVGPDLASLSSREPKALLQSIFDPNREIDERFRSYRAISVDGLAHAGILLGETSTSVTLLEQQGKQTTLLRSDLDVFENVGKSLMPEGLERDVSKNDAANLVAYLAAIGPKAKSIPGNAPRVVAPGEHGVLALTAATAEIFGEQITFEQPFKNIGYWHGRNDFVAWKLKHASGGEFEVYLHWACADDSAGNKFVIECGPSALRGVVGATGGYDHYQTRRLGRLALAPGDNRLVLRPDGSLTRPHLMDLHAIYLVPEGVDPKQALAGKAPIASDAATSIAPLLDGLAVGTPAEYERIPAIWEHAIAAGRRNESAELLRVLELSLPKKNQPLHDWQAVVVGGGVINGMSQQGAWPRDRMAELLSPHPALEERWRRTVELSEKMAGDDAVRSGTRYDALRILGADTWERQGARLANYLGKDVNAELQMGAVSACADFSEPEAAEALVAAIPHLQEHNRRLAVQGLLRTKEKRLLLNASLNSGAIPAELLTPDERAKAAGDE